MISTANKTEVKFLQHLHHVFHNHVFQLYKQHFKKEPYVQSLF